MPEVIAVENLCYTYPDGQPALCGVSLSIQEGETVALIGPNGAGKSTLLFHLNGLLHSHEGAVRVLGQIVHDKNLKTVRRQVGMVFQNPDNQLFSPTVFDDVAFGPLNLGMKEAEVCSAVQQSLEAVGMTGYEKRSPHHMSLGEKRRIAIATVLAMSPAVLVLDEPSANLDPGGKWHLIELLRSLPQTKLIVSHDLEMVQELCSRAIVMDGGRVVADGSQQDILKDRILLMAHRLAAPNL
ncbi:MAG: energy-coupling factor ABC transporter ATP-binding protein [Dehalococcoidia bacterium]|nr:energy-coupling factor ABC transporter ATP-binding protein [Dehalococcoidia bacterium]